MTSTPADIDLVAPSAVTNGRTNNYFADNYYQKMVKMGWISYNLFVGRMGSLILVSLEKFMKFDPGRTVLLGCSLLLVDSAHFMGHRKIGLSTFCRSSDWNVIFFRLSLKEMAIFLVWKLILLKFQRKCFLLNSKASLGSRIWKSCFSIRLENYLNVKSRPC